MKDKIFTREDFVKWGAMGGRKTKETKGVEHFKQMRKKVKNPGPKPKHI